jgi:hypothetical protein
MFASSKERLNLEQDAKMKAQNQNDSHKTEAIRIPPTRLDYALRCAARGWAVFPLHWVEDGNCSCPKLQCPKAGKHPLTKHGVTEATTDKAQIRAWWQQHPEANIGIATGAQSGLIVLDVDHNGYFSLQ